MMEREQYLKMKRAERVMNLTGKWVIVADSTKRPGTVMYLQDQTLSTKGFWTGFLANAKGYESEEEANLMLAKPKYNNPRLMRIS